MADEDQVDPADRKFVWQPDDITFLPVSQTADLTTTPPAEPEEETK